MICQHSLKPLFNIGNNILKIHFRGAKKIHWAQVLKKKWPKDQALTYFDDFYGPIYGKSWPSIRLALLCPLKYCAILNNYSSIEDQISVMLKVGTFDVKSVYEKRLGNALKRNVSKLTNDTTLPNESPEEGSSQSESEQEQILAEQDNILRSYGGMNQFVSPTQLTGLEDRVDETDYIKHYDNSVDVPFQHQLEKPLTFPEHLKMYVFGRGNVTSFPAPKRDCSDLFGYYLMDAASVLPALFLDVKPGNHVLDLCSAPGGKALTLLQTLMPVSIVCNDNSESRLRRLRTVLNDYLPDLDSFKNKIYYSNGDAEDWKEYSTYDKVLVDVPCTNDRLSVNENENNWFTSRRLKERIGLPQHQINMLYSALQAVKPGGTVVYSTCSLSPVQNDGVVHMALKKLSENTSLQFIICDLKNAVKPFRFLYRFQDLRYGQLVLPFLPLNYGPMYFSKLIRIK